MRGNRFIPRGTNPHPDPRLGRLLLVSLGLHLVVLVLFSVTLSHRFSTPQRPVYYVDLVNPPVRDPQAGLPPVAPPKAQPPKAEPAPAPPAPKPVPPAEKPQPKKAEPAPAKPSPAAAAKPAPKTDTTAEAIEKMRRRQEIEEQKRALAAIASRDTRQSGSAPSAPLGMPEGRGSEAGPSEQALIQAHLKKNWSFSKYQAPRRDLTVDIRLVYDGGGQLLDYRILKSSGDAAFDESVRKAILKGQELPFQPGRRLELEAQFNLKDLLE